MSPVAAVPNTEVANPNWLSVWSDDGMILDIFEYGIKALCIFYNELENGAVILIWHTKIASYLTTEYHANGEGLPLPWLQLEKNNGS